MAEDSPLTDRQREPMEYINMHTGERSMANSEGLGHWGQPSHRRWWQVWRRSHSPAAGLPAGQSKAVPAPVLPLNRRTDCTDEFTTAVDVDRHHRQPLIPTWGAVRKMRQLVCHWRGHQWARGRVDHVGGESELHPGIVTTIHHFCCLRCGMVLTTIEDDM